MSRTRSPPRNGSSEQLARTRPDRYPRRVGRRLDDACCGHDRHQAGAAVQRRRVLLRRLRSAWLRGQTHDFESHYLDGLIGPMPGFEIVYEERAPVGHVNAATCPICCCRVWTTRRAACAVREHRRGPGRARHPPRLHRVRGRVARLPEGRDGVAALEAELSFYGQILGFTRRACRRSRSRSGRPVAPTAKFPVGPDFYQARAHQAI